MSLSQFLNIKHIDIILLLIIGLFLIAAVPRFVSLDALSFEGDEETTAFASRSFALNNDPVLPSGMQYRRAILHTWLNSISVKLFGINQESSYRLVSALFGSLTIIIFFAMGRKLFGYPVALIAAVLLALSEWHIILSREARMYVLFLFFFIGSTFSMWYWLQFYKYRYLLLSILLFIGALTSHQLAVFLLIAWLSPMAFFNIDNKRLFITVFVGVAAFVSAFVYSDYISTAYSNMHLNDNLGSNDSTTLPIQDAPPINFILENIWLAILFIAVVFMLGNWLSRKHDIYSPEQSLLTRNIAIKLFAFICCAFVLTGNLHAALLTGYIYLLIDNENIRTFIQSKRYPLALLLIVSFTWLIYAISDLGFKGGIKSISMIPFPYELSLAGFMPGVFILFTITSIYYLNRPYTANSLFIRSSIFFSVLTILAIGILKPWGSMRYFIIIYPFMLISASYCLYKIAYLFFRIFNKHESPVVVISALILVISGIIGQHGISNAVQVATLDHGERVSTLKFSFYPDHKSAGEYVKSKYSPEDIIIAEDALQQAWYAGHVDYWLRDFNISKSYLYIDSNNELRDIYVGSKLATSDFLDTLPEEPGRSIWIITSGETHQKWDYYLDTRQLEWMTYITENIEPVFVASDGITKVFCITGDNKPCAVHN